MGHEVTGLIAESKTLNRITQEYSLPSPITLSQGFSLLPLSYEVLDQLVPESDGSLDNFCFLSPALISVIKSISLNSNIVYFETEYLGGVGSQGVAVFCNGELVYAPERSKFGRNLAEFTLLRILCRRKNAKFAPINKALSYLGVKILNSCLDEFESIGLHRNRSTDEAKKICCTGIPESKRTIAKIFQINQTGIALNAYVEPIRINPKVCYILSALNDVFLTNLKILGIQPSQ